MDNEIQNIIDAKDAFLNSFRENFNEASTPQQQSAMKECTKEKGSRDRECGISR